MKFKKLILVIIAVSIIASLFAFNINAGQKKVSVTFKVGQTEVKLNKTSNMKYVDCQFDESVSKLKKYLKRNSDGTIKLNVPQEVVQKTPFAAEILANVQEVNSKIKNNEFKSDNEFNITFTEKGKIKHKEELKKAQKEKGLTLSAGVNKTETYWWGVEEYYDSNIAHGMLTAMKGGAIGTAFLPGVLGKVAPAIISTIMIPFSDAEAKHTGVVVRCTLTFLPTGVWAQ